MKSTKVTHYQIDSFEENGKLLVKVYNLNAKKEWHKQIAFYSFRSEDERAEYIKNLIASYEGWEKIKNDRKNARKNVVNTFEVGDILYNSWGYDQTNIDFYQVVKVLNRQVILKEIAGHLTDKSTGNSMAGYTVAVKNKFTDGQEYRGTVSQYGIASKLDHSGTEHLSKWDGRELYCSWYA